MSISLENYRDLINLDNDWLPSAVSYSESKLIELLQNDRLTSNYVNSHCLPVDPGKVREWIREVLTIRHPGNLSDDIFIAIDSLLQSELKNKKLTKPENLVNFVKRINLKTKISVWHGDMCNLTADAVINSANSEMLGCFTPEHDCLDNRLHNCAGPQMREDCSKIMSLQTALPVHGDSFITRAYNLPSKYVIHTLRHNLRDVDISDYDIESI
jgi:hypothetical protein